MGKNNHLHRSKIEGCEKKTITYIKIELRVGKKRSPIQQQNIGMGKNDHLYKSRIEDWEKNDQLYRSRIEGWEKNDDLYRSRIEGWKKTITYIEVEQRDWKKNDQLYRSRIEGWEKTDNPGFTLGPGHRSMTYQNQK